MRNCSLRVSLFALLMLVGVGAEARGHATEKTVIQTESTAIPTQVEYLVSRSVTSGRTLKYQEGKQGKIERTYEVTFIGGRQTSKKLISESRVEAKPTVILLGPKGFASSRHRFGRDRVLVMSATAYDPSPATIGRGATHRTRTGRWATFGVVAVDPRVIPLNTMVYVEGYGLALACDTGSAIKGNRIDLCYDSKRVADAFGRKKVVVHVLR